MNLISFILASYFLPGVLLMVLLFMRDEGAPNSPSPVIL
jgi:hypothetical protein